MIIVDANKFDLEHQHGNLPNMSDAIISWMIPLTFIGIDKTIENFQVKETLTNINFKGVWIEEKRQIQNGPEGQRSWRQFSCYSEPGLILNIDEIICYMGKRYRVVGIEDHRNYGYVHYSMMEDFT